MKKIILILFLSSFIQYGFSQDKTKKKERPRFKLFRAEEDYSYLKDLESSAFEVDEFDVIKLIPLSVNKNIYATLGGEIRPRFEFFSNRKWDSEDDEKFYSQRISLHTNFVLGKHIRVFGELYHGYTSHEKEFVQYDELGFHQTFIELKFSLKDINHISTRFGRQEMAFGATRLVGLREGPNMRRSFDAIRIVLTNRKTTLQAFYGTEVRPNFYAFDNDFTLFENKVSNPKIWGIYSQFRVKKDIGNNELYYLGFESNLSRYNDVFGIEKRHTIGLRRFGKLGKRFSYNTELIYQFGDVGSSSISAFSFETDWNYKLNIHNLKPTIGLKLDWSSGDKTSNDGKLNTFNPMFVNPAYYSLATTVTPVNLISFHPSLKLHPSEKLSLFTEWGVFWRASKNDGLYNPPRFLSRNANGIPNVRIGNELGLKIAYELNRHWSLDLDNSYFFAGSFIKASGKSENILHIAPTVSYKF